MPFKYFYKDWGDGGIQNIYKERDETFLYLLNYICTYYKLWRFLDTLRRIQKFTVKLQKQKGIKMREKTCMKNPPK